MVTELEENLNNVTENIRNACMKAKRNLEEVKLIAVSKTKPVSDIETVYKIGLRDFGENKVQELDDKYSQLPIDCKWHLIGHLQRNKVKYIIDKVALIHSVDSLRLANQIDEEACKKNICVNILIQVNVSNEDSKFGLAIKDTISTIYEISKLNNIRIKGLMTIAPFTENSENNRIYFKQLKNLSDEISNLKIENVEMKELSMGMTGDYMVAIEEGATLVRVGTGIFGNRMYNTTVF